MCLLMFRLSTSSCPTMTKRKPDDENEAPTTKARKSNQASTSKQAKNALEGRLSQGGKVSGIHDDAHCRSVWPW